MHKLEDNCSIQQYLWKLPHDFQDYTLIPRMTQHLEGKDKLAAIRTSGYIASLCFTSLFLMSPMMRIWWHLGATAIKTCKVWNEDLGSLWGHFIRWLEPTRWQAEKKNQEIRGVLDTTQGLSAHIRCNFFFFTTHIWTGAPKEETDHCENDIKKQIYIYNYKNNNHTKKTRSIYI